MRFTTVRPTENSLVKPHDPPSDNRPVRDPNITAEANERDSPPIQLSRKDKEKMDSEQARLGAVALEGMALLRGSMNDVVQGERHPLQEARHDHYKAVDNLAARLGKEKGHLKFT